jgi:hypothetical protein
MIKLERMHVGVEGGQLLRGEPAAVMTAVANVSYTDMVMFEVYTTGSLGKVK